ncbi:MAG: CRISPR-associated RAMP protein Csx7 [Aigarchaeota archaeon]|nr:CRISPR-associated RAMP protein Csx7 [Aigarchaeota archaeon]
MGYGDFDNFKALYELKMELINETPLSIGSGKSAFGAVDNPIVRMGKRPYIPGSSLKGVLRAESERFVRAHFGEDKVCNIMYPKEELDKKEKQKEAYKPCIVCRIFGGPTIASHITIYDAYPMDDNYSVKVRRRVSICRLTGGQHPGRLFEVEQVEPGARWLCTMRIENIEILGDGQEEEVKVLRALMGIMGKFGITVGGKRSIGLGLLKVRLLEARKLVIEDGQYKYVDVTDSVAKLFEGRG